MARWAPRPIRNLFVVGSTNECGNLELLLKHPEYIPGQAYKAVCIAEARNGPASGRPWTWQTGNVRWEAQVPYPAQGCALITATVLVFTIPRSGVGVCTRSTLRPQRNSEDQYRLVDLCTIFHLYVGTAINTLRILVCQSEISQTRICRQPRRHVLVYEVRRAQTSRQRHRRTDADGGHPASAASASNRGAPGRRRTRRNRSCGAKPSIRPGAVCHETRLARHSAPLDSSQFCEVALKRLADSVRRWRRRCR